MQVNTLVGIYCRLSVDDKINSSDSISIEYQKKILTDCVNQQGWQLEECYIDDGYSGTNFDRPGFKKMLFDIDNGRINTIITKDLSRLGREYIQTGYYIDSYFPNHNVRYIAVNDNIDTKVGYDEYLPFKNILNEMYAKDCSKKIRFTLDNNIKNGKDTKTSLPLYGYMYEDGKRIKDPDTAPIVRLIFVLFLKGNNYSSITKTLEKKEILSPMFYNYNKYNYGSTLIEHSKYGMYHWNKQTISNILTNDAYIGVLRRGKTTHKFKSKKKILIPKEKQYTFTDKFDAIIDKDIFEASLKQASNISLSHRNTTVNRYSGIVYCMICGKPLRHKSDKRVNQKDYVRLTCRNKCCGVNKGSITYSELDKYVKNELLSIKKVILKNKEAFINSIKDSKIMHKSETSILLSLKRKLKNDLKKIDNKIKKAYEDKINNILIDSTYEIITNEYLKEKENINNSINKINSEIDNKSKASPDYYGEANRFITSLESINNINCTNKDNLKNLISKIYISKDEIKSGKLVKKKIVIIYGSIDDIVKNFISSNK